MTLPFIKGKTINELKHCFQGIWVKNEFYRVLEEAMQKHGMVG